MVQAYQQVAQRNVFHTELTPLPELIRNENALRSVDQN